MTLFTITIAEDFRFKHTIDNIYILCDDDIILGDVEMLAGEYYEIDSNHFFAVTNEDYDVTLDNVLNFIDSEQDVNMFQVVTDGNTGKVFYFFQ